MIFLACSPAFAHHADFGRALEADLRPWNLLKRDAGYCTKSGLWRGGLSQFAQNSEKGHNHCVNNIGTHCMAWHTAEVNRKRHDGGMCTCEETTEHFCQRWTCESSLRHRCKRRPTSKECIKLKKLECHCTHAAKNGKYCRRWSCRKEAGAKGGHAEDYRCVIPDASGDFCRRWRGNSSSESIVESSACECFRRGESFCDAWMCREREITRCEAFGHGWCRLKIAIGVGGGMGLFCFILSICCTVHFCQVGGKLTFTIVYSCFLLFCLPWLAGVFIWGGIFGLPWVLLMWSVAIAMALYLAKIKSTKEVPAAEELPTTTNSKE